MKTLRGNAGEVHISPLHRALAAGAQQVGKSLNSIHCSSRGCAVFVVRTERPFRKAAIFD